MNPDELPITQVIVDPQHLSDETLVQLAREFILRELGQENSATDVDSTIPKVIEQLRRGEFLITFDSETESVGVKQREIR